MDDRHSLSEPRPILDDSSNLPTWEVDVFREGVSDPLLTLRINNETLPPRQRKKKIIWKLPDSLDQTPSFGSDEKRRIWDLYKVQKKSRRKSKRDSIKSPPSSNGAPKEEMAKEEETMNGGTTGSSAHHRHGSESVVNESEPPGLGLNGSFDENGTATLAPFPPSASAPPPPPPGLFEKQAEPKAQFNGISPLEQSTKPPPPHISAPSPHSSATMTMNDSSTPPPGFLQQSQPSSLPFPPAQQQPTQLPSQPASLQPLHVTQQPPPSQPTQQQQQHPQLSFSVTHDCPNIPVEVAKSVIDLYYKLVSTGDTQLYHYFVPGSFQKSLSVGGAHHVCTTVEEVLLQIQSLQHSQWQVRGVVAQEGIQSSVVLLITGIVVVCGAPQPEKMSYCHSLTLIPIRKGEYQIHNDALAFLK